MTVVKETRQIFSVTDIKAIRLQCKGKEKGTGNDCQTEVVVSLDNPNVERCPKCWGEWREKRDYTDPNNLLVSAIKAVVDAPPTAMTVRFEIDGDST